MLRFHLPELLSNVLIKHPQAAEGPHNCLASKRQGTLFGGVTVYGASAGRKTCAKVDLSGKADGILLF